jgi:hypothetical protein
MRVGSCGAGAGALVALLLSGCGGGEGEPAAAGGPVGTGEEAGTGGAGAGSGGAGGAGSSGAAGISPGVEAGVGGAAGDGACVPCERYGAPEALADVQLAELAQLSGIAVSSRDARVLFAHNDRASTTVFALGLDGGLLARFELEGVTTVDLEDIAVGACPGGVCLYVADIGGNLAARSEYAILRAPEPEVDPGAPATDAVSLPVEVFRFAYEDGAHNAEGILIDPGSGALYVVTKEAAGQPSHVYELRIDPGQPFESAFAAEPVALEAGDEPQSEGVSYLPDGRGFVTSGEMASQPIYRSSCAP